ncbi:MAG: glutathione S-transferase N-terminal domain-containing protein [Acidobacteriota bacterium]|nr:glutathione S-transferase N-terminal domain-containing protein [Acidobacteriota bacterium]
MREAGAGAVSSNTERLELWQTEWCPASRRVRQRLTELGLSFTAHQVPVEPERRTKLHAATGCRTIPVLVGRGEVVAGEGSILRYLDERFTEPPDASSQREKAAKAKGKELEKACMELTASTR